MCDEELIAAILEDLGYIDRKKKEDRKEDVYEDENIKEEIGSSEEGEQK